MPLVSHLCYWVVPAVLVIAFIGAVVVTQYRKDICMAYCSHLESSIRRVAEPERNRGILEERQMDFQLGEYPRFAKELQIRCNVQCQMAELSELQKSNLHRTL